TGVARGTAQGSGGIDPRHSGILVSGYRLPIRAIPAIAGHEHRAVERDVLDVIDDRGDAALTGLSGVCSAELEAAEEQGALDGLEAQRGPGLGRKDRGLVDGLPVVVTIEAAVDARALRVAQRERLGEGLRTDDDELVFVEGALDGSGHRRDGCRARAGRGIVAVGGNEDRVVVTDEAGLGPRIAVERAGAGVDAPGLAARARAATIRRAAAAVLRPGRARGAVVS